MPRHVVVDGSNVATEGRTMPSLAQLNEAVMAYMGEYPEDKITVVVDATFGHRIDPSEVAEFNAAIENNELVCPPAGAVGRGDAFVLAIAHKVGASILSNDSYQEFHGDHDWLFDEGRLIGGKPVPHVGWVFVFRTPVRGPISRRAVKGKKAPSRGAGTRPTPAASLPMPVPKSPPPRSSRAAKAATGGVGDDAVTGGVLAEAAAEASGAVPAGDAPSSGRGRNRRGRDRGKAAANGAVPVEPTAAAAPAAKPTAKPVPGAQAASQGTSAFVNEPLPFIHFVDAHPVGSRVDAQVESYSSHGAYVLADGARCYIPLRYMASPAPRAARDVLKLGQTFTFVVVNFNPGRRSVDVALPGFEPADVVAAPAAAAASAPAAETPSERPAKKGRKKAAGRRAVAVEPELEPVSDRARTRRGRKAAPAPADAPVVETPVVEVAPAVTEPGKGRRGRKAAATPVPVPTVPAAPVAEPLPLPMPAVEPTPAPARGRGRGRKVAEAPVAPVTPPAPSPAPVKPARKAAKAAAPAPAKAPAKKAAAAPAPAKKAAPAPAPAKKAAKAAKAPAKKAAPAAAPAPVKAAKAPAKKAAPAPAAKAAPAKKAPAKAAAKKAPAKAAKAPAKKAARKA